MKKIILFTILICFLAVVTIAGGVYFQKKDQIAELEKAGMEFLTQGLEDELAAGTNASDGLAAENQGDGAVGAAPGQQDSGVQGRSGKLSITSINQVSNKDKLAAAKIILTKVPVGELNLLKDMAKGGITAEEKKKAQNIIQSRLSQDDMDSLKAIARKYTM